jgi:hypothetical protein
LIRLAEYRIIFGEEYRHVQTYSVSYLKCEIVFFKGEPNFSLWELEVPGDEGGGRILLGDYTVDGTVMLRVIIFQRFEIRVSVGLHYNW